MPAPQWLSEPDAIGFYWLVTPDGLTLAEVSVASGAGGLGIAGFVYLALCNGFTPCNGWRTVAGTKLLWQRIYEPFPLPQLPPAA